MELKKKGSLTLFRETGTNRILVFYGASLLERVPDDPDHISYRTAGGRLYNAGINRSVLSKAFDVDRRTLQSWGNALLLDDKKEAVRILTGQTKCKLTAEILQFTKVRFYTIYPNNHYSYSKQIREEIEEVFGITLSSEILRKRFNHWKDDIEQTSTTKSDESKRMSHNNCDCGKSSSEPSTVLPVDSRAGSESNNRKSDVSSAQFPRFIRHAGIALFSSFLAEIGNLFDSKGVILKQWLTIFFLEAVNIEQSKYLDFYSLSHLLGKTIRRPFVQRQLLNDIANEDTFNKLFRLNGMLCDIDNCSDFYYDPHTKHYTGIRKILKGWCASAGHPDKVLHSDFIHSSNGQPLYMVHADNYLDLRERYRSVISVFRKCFGIENSKCITMIIDRGIYSKDVLNAIEQEPSLHLITWEKNFKKDDVIWEKYESFYFGIKKYRNNSTDIRHYHFQCVDVTWHKNPRIRRLVVRATNPSGRTIELGILATDMKRKPEEVISLIFSRWIQENDFKYLEKHYGMNQIISYDTIDYTELAKSLNDKEITSGTYKALAYDKLQEEKRLKNYLLKKHQRTLKTDNIKKRLEVVEIQLKELNEKQSDHENTGKLKKERRTLKAQLGRLKKRKVDEYISECTVVLQKISKQLEETKKHDSKLETLVGEGYKSLDIRKKKLMDILKIYARNIFYHMFQNFKIAYDNFRDDHNYFRNLSHADGVMKISEEVVEIKLFPAAYLEPKIKKIMEEYLEQISKTSLIMPDGSNRKLILSLIADKTLELANV